MFCSSMVSFFKFLVPGRGVSEDVFREMFWVVNTLFRCFKSAGFDSTPQTLLALSLRHLLDSSDDGGR